MRFDIFFNDHEYKLVHFDWFRVEDDETSDQEIHLMEIYSHILVVLNNYKEIRQGIEKYRECRRLSISIDQTIMFCMKHRTLLNNSMNIE